MHGLVKLVSFVSHPVNQSEVTGCTAVSQSDIYSIIQSDIHSIIQSDMTYEHNDGLLTSFEAMKSSICLALN